MDNDRDPPNSPPRDFNGWDGKLRVTSDQDASPPESENGDFPEEEFQGESLDADEDLLDDIEADEMVCVLVDGDQSHPRKLTIDPDLKDIDLNHCRITSIPALKLERFPKLEILCLRQNQISHVSFPSSLGNSLKELDLYDNAISHIKGLDDLDALQSLDLSFNKIKHIKKVSHLKALTDLYFVQNKISKIEGLEGLSNVRNLELASNRIREIENLDTLTNLQQLWLGRNKISELKNLGALQNLNLLSIQSNRLTSSSLSHLSQLPHLEELYISHNLLEEISALSKCTSLRTIDICSNPITSISGLGPLKLLEELWASDCQLDNFEEVERELRDKEHLTTVYFEGNSLQTRKKELYRNKVRLALPQIKQIDATFVKLS